MKTGELSEFEKKIIGKWTYHHDADPSSSYVYQIKRDISYPNISLERVFSSRREAELAMIKSIRKQLKRIELWLLAIETMPENEKSKELRYTSPKKWLKPFLERDK